MGDICSKSKSYKYRGYQLNWYKILKVGQSNLPDIWLDNPDPFEGANLKYDIKIIPLNDITGVAWTVNSVREEIEEIFRMGKIKLPLTLVEDKGNNIYELHDGQHRYAAYKNIFPNLTHIKVAIFTSNK